MNAVLAFQIFSCFFMTGLIWMVQLVHYPSFNFVKDNFQSFHQFHSNRITWIVLPVMTLELITAAILAYHEHSNLWIPNLIGVILIWLSTALLSVPQHTLLTEQSSSETIKRLVFTNWIRTFLWTTRSGVLVLNLAFTTPLSNMLG